MENDFIPGNTPQGNRTTLHHLFLSSISHHHSLVLPKPLKMFVFFNIFVLMIHTYIDDQSNPGAVTVGISVHT